MSDAEINALVEDSMKDDRAGHRVFRKSGTGTVYRNYNSKESPWIGKAARQGNYARRLRRAGAALAKGGIAAGVAIGIAHLLGETAMADTSVDGLADEVNAGWPCQQYWQHLFEAVDTGYCNVSYMNRFAGDCQNALLTWDLPYPIVAWDKFSAVHEEAVNICSAAQPGGGGGGCP